MEIILLFSEAALPANASTLYILLLGFVLGLQHATDADHLAAVSTIVSERKSLWSSAIIGGFWGIGHTISLFLVGLLVIFLKLQISETLEGYLEAIVGAMLVGLGLNVLRKLWKGEKIHAHSHEHDGRAHVHVHAHAEENATASHHKLSPRSVVIGMIHGLAGSAALMLLVVPSIDSPAVALSYILVFGIGSIGGMMAMSFLIGLPFHLTAGNFVRLNQAVRLCAGVFSVFWGAKMIYEMLFAATT